MWSFDTSNQEFNKKKLEFLGNRDFYASLKICSFWKLTSAFENRHQHRFKTTAVAMEGQSIYSHIDWFRPIFKAKVIHPAYFCFFVHKFKLSIKWFLSGEYNWSLCKLKPKHEEIIPWNLLESNKLYRRCSRENLCVCIRKTSMFSNEQLRPFLETPKLILTHSNRWYWFKANIDEHCHKIYIFAEKSTSGILCVFVFKSFQYICFEP